MTAIAIDGPAGAGKSTIARRVADALGFAYVDTGALYRAITLAALEAGAELGDGAALGRLATALDVMSSGDVVTLEGRDVSHRIRRPDVTAAVSTVSAHPEVRAALMGLQRRLAAAGDVVMEGRDIGSTVLPDAALKIYLTASLAERARRRWLQDGKQGDPTSIEAAIQARDKADESRTHSPLMRAHDAVDVDTTGRSIEEIVAAVVDALQARRRGEA